MESIRAKMKKYFKIIKIEIFGRLFFHIIYMIAIAAMPYVIKSMIDCGFKDGIYDVIKWTIIFVLAVIMGMSSQYFSQLCVWKMDKKFYENIRQDYFRAIISKQYKEFWKKDPSEYGSIINHNIATCEEYVEYVMEIIESIMGMIIYAVYIFALDIRIAIAIYLAAVIALFLPKITGANLSQKKMKLLNATGEYTKTVVDLLSGFSFVDLFTYKNVNKMHNKKLLRLEQTRYEFGKFKTFTNVLNGVVMYIVNITAFAIIATLLSMGIITVGVAAATISYIQDFMYPLRTIIDSVNLLKSTKGTSQEIIDEINSIRSIKKYEKNFSSKIVVSNISKYYMDNKVIDNFSYKFEKGKKYAIIGESGTGKTTLLNLIMGIDNTDSGKIIVDDLESESDMCHEIMEYLTQSAHVFEASFKDNVTMFGSYLYNEVLNCFTGSHEYDYLYDAEDCTKLSGGEKQLVLLSRAWLSEKQVLLLDEPFSAMDKSLEYQVCQWLFNTDKTVIMITHNINDNFLNLFDEVICLGQ